MRRKNLTAEIRRMLLDGERRCDIGRHFGLSNGTISYHASKLGIAHSEFRPKWRKRTVCICGKETKRPGLKNCSQKCNQRRKFLDFIEKWKAGSETGVRSNGMCTSEYIRHYLIETRGEKCEVCGWAERNPVSGNIPVQLEHVDGNAENNKECNLKLLCPNCHSLTPTYMGLNRGNGRSARRINRHVSIDGDALDL